MIDFISQYLWWIFWLMILPLMLFLSVVYYILRAFDDMKLDIRIDEDDI